MFSGGVSMPTVCSPQRSSPRPPSPATHARRSPSFSTTLEWNAYQDDWFKTVTMGEVLPPVGESNRAKRWKSTHQQRGKIEAQRTRQQQPQPPRQPQGRTELQKERDNEHHKEKWREAQHRCRVSNSRSASSGA